MEAPGEAAGAPGSAPVRRGVLGFLAAAAAAMAAMALGPAGAMFFAPLLRRREGGGTWVPVGAADRFGEELQVVSYRFRSRDGWYTAEAARSAAVLRQGESWRVLSTECTHAGCAVTWDPDGQVFLCPCHEGKFDAEGRPIAGPPPRPLAPLEARVNASTGQLEVREA